MRIKDYPKTNKPKQDDVFLVDGDNGTKAVKYSDLFAIFEELGRPTNTESFNASVKLPNGIMICYGREVLKFTSSSTKGAWGWYEATAKFPNYHTPFREGEFPVVIKNLAAGKTPFLTQHVYNVTNKNPGEVKALMAMQSYDGTGTATYIAVGRY